MEEILLKRLHKRLSKNLMSITAGLYNIASLSHMDSEERGKNKNKSLNKHLICLTRIKTDQFHGKKWEIY